MSVNHFVNSRCVQCFRIEKLSVIDAKGARDVADSSGHKVSHMDAVSFAVSSPDLGVCDRSGVFDVRRYDIGVCGGVSNQQAIVIAGAGLVDDPAVFLAGVLSTYAELWWVLVVAFSRSGRQRRPALGNVVVLAPARRGGGRCFGGRGVVTQGFDCFAEGGRLGGLTTLARVKGGLVGGLDAAVGFEGCFLGGLEDCFPGFDFEMVADLLVAYLVDLRLSGDVDLDLSRAISTEGRRREDACFCNISVVVEVDAVGFGRRKVFWLNIFKVK